MNRWIWLAVLPWVVVASTVTQNCKYRHYSEAIAERYDCEVTTMSYVSPPGSNRGSGITFGSPESDQDFVDAMNEAHERRTNGLKEIPCPPTMNGFCYEFENPEN